VTARGNARCRIFEDDEDRQMYLRLLGRTVDRFDWRCLSYCLMDNHVHVLLMTPNANLSRGMQQLGSMYAQSFNRRHERVGHLFAGRYGARLVQQDAHLLAVFRYIARNPVAAEMCNDPAAWSWSAHRALTGEVPAPAFLAADEALAWFGGDRRRYGAFVASADDPPEPGTGAATGDASFLRAVLPDASPDPEIPVREWGEGRPPLGSLLRAPDRDRAAAQAYRQHGYTMREIAEHLGCHVSTVSRRLHAHELRMRECKI